MNKVKQLLNRNMVAIRLGIAIGVAFSLFNSVRTCKKVSKCLDGVSNAQERAFKSNWQRESRIRELRELIRDYEYRISIDRLHELKNELCELTGEEKPVKIYAGKWSMAIKEGFLHELLHSY